ncbi:glycoside hydrolase family 15 protein [Bradyrhizobium genosp. P]|uniref:glycoside hydrolase family 15 protein n=1 Tax=Bradyrhizobium genosp. P TaxID=83641 RepID=UPI003CEE533A
MPARIEDYAAIGNCESMALVGRDGSIDWLSFPRFDSAACFSALLGEPKHGRWLIAPLAEPVCVTRRYRGDTMILETTIETETGAICLIDFMSRREGVADLVRIVRGQRGTVTMHTELIVRFEFGSIVPWVSRRDDGRREITAGPDMLILAADVPLRGEGLTTVGKFDITAGEQVSFILSWSRSYDPAPAPHQPGEALAQVEGFWANWSNRFTKEGKWSEAVMRSLLTLKALSHRETGGIVAAGTTSLPEKVGGSRNWDYRFCWLRDATFTLYALLGAGFVEEARAWREWLLRAIAGSPGDLQIMYGVAGERHQQERELAWLPGYAGSSPVRVGNAAAKQLQLDVYGELLDALYVARKAGLPSDRASWSLERRLLDHLEAVWNQPDSGIWEVRGDRRHFTHSKIMAWVAFDRAVRSVEELGLDGPVAHWRSIRDVIHREVCVQGYDPVQNSFVQSYGSTELDASLLLTAMVGFLPPSDIRIRNTIAAIEKDLMRDGLVQRYRTEKGDDGLPAGEGTFLACTFWLADNYVLQGRCHDARRLLERLLSLRNDVGLLAEEYDPVARRQLGNFPQALSHLALINTVHNLTRAVGTVHQRAAATGKNG